MGTLYQRVPDNLGGLPDQRTTEYWRGYVVATQEVDERAVKS
jgi:hypothetical protein